jgi:hypothetical protein
MAAIEDLFKEIKSKYDWAKTFKSKPVGPGHRKVTLISIVVVLFSNAILRYLLGMTSGLSLNCQENGSWTMSVERDIIKLDTSHQSTCPIKHFPTTKMLELVNCWRRHLISTLLDRLFR